MFTLLLESSVLALDDTVISLNEFLNYLRIANNIGTLDSKTDRALERLRRAGVKALETTSDSPTSEKLGMLLSAVVDILETVISLVSLASAVIHLAYSLSPPPPPRNQNGAR